MSGRRDKPETTKTSGSRMLKKARSFKDDLKSKIIRRTPSASRDRNDVPVITPRSKSPKHRRRGLHRGSSFNEGRQRKEEKLKPKETDVEKLEAEYKKVTQALSYMQDVVDKNILMLLPGSATVVLEITMELHTLLSNYFIDEDSTILLSAFNKVYQSLAGMIRWADNIMLQGDKALDKEKAKEVIEAVSDGIKELMLLSVEKLKKKSLATYSTIHKCSTNKNGSPSSESHRNSLPDIPLTPRERKILEETSQLSSYNHHISRSHDDILDSHFDFPDSPPPKPPLPCVWNSPLSVTQSPMCQTSHAVMPDLNADTPPPLPAKRRSQSTSSTLDSSGSVISGQSTPTMTSPMHTSTGSLGASQLSPPSISPFTPLSQSPTSSISSALSASSEDLLEDRSSVRSSLTTSPTHQTSEGRFSHYDNLLVTRDPQPVHQINELTRKINEMTSNIDSTGNSNVSQRDSLGESEAGESGIAESDTSETIAAPPIPVKTGARRTLLSRIPSQYDNMPGEKVECSRTESFVAQTQMARMHHSAMRTSHSAIGISTISSHHAALAHAQAMSAQVTLSQEAFSSSETFSSTGTYSSSAESLQKPPPLPPKQRHVQAYMQIFGQANATLPTQSVLHEARHSVHSVNFYQAQWYQHQLEIFHPFYPRSKTISIMSDISSRNSDVFSIASGSSGEDPNTLSIPALPPKSGSTSSAGSRLSDSPLAISLPTEDMATSPKPIKKRPPTTDKEDSSSEGDKRMMARMSSSSSSTRHSSPPPEIQKDGDSDFAELSTLDDVDVSDQLIRKKPEDDGPEIRGGSVDALIVHATTAGKSDFMYQEAFLTTYRTYITPRELIEKLLYRYNRFSHMNDVKRKRLSRNAFSFMVRVVDELRTEIDDELLQMLTELVVKLLCDGELMLARILRKKVIEMCELRKQLLEASQRVTLLSSFQLTAKQHRLTDFKSEQLAEQMTRCDADLFMKIEIPEVLLWSKEQNEEKSGNLTKFTEHFNKMSYWVRTRILYQEDAKERERYLMKFIKIMKHLRKFNNFNSYLAILSALDSAPIRRLEWQKSNSEALCEFCQLIDSTSSFRAYRHALAETEPPCIPYIGLILQDLTFVHIGNRDWLGDGMVNFSKRWQQFNILDSMRRFKKCNYQFKRNHKIIAFFNNFDDCLSEESLWQISESIKPRGGKKT